MTGSEGAFPVSGSASQTVNPGISRREWYVGQLIASGEFPLNADGGCPLRKSAAIRTMFQIAEDLIIEELKRVSWDRAAAQELLDELQKQSSAGREFPEVVSGFVELPVKSAAELKEIMAQACATPLCGPSWIAAPVQAMAKQRAPALESWRADWGETEIPVKADPEAWNPMFGVPEPPAALVDEHSADEQGRMDALTDLKERGLL